MDRSLIERYERGAGEPARYIAGLTREQLDAFPVPGTWSIRQIVVHVLDSDLIATHRMRRIVAEDRPLLIGYDETLFAQRMGYAREDLGVVCRLFALNREWTSSLLRRLPDADFARVGVHNQRGLLSLGEMVRLYVDHLTHHERFVREKRALLGAPL
ncbi:MAG: DinB family protein [Phycisphaerae bacterium]|nr:DinB family protein [Phycisphaerae bacterium]